MNRRLLRRVYRGFTIGRRIHGQCWRIYATSSFLVYQMRCEDNYHLHMLVLSGCISLKDMKILIDQFWLPHDTLAQTLIQSSQEHNIELDI